MTLKVERISTPTGEVTNYLQANLAANALDLWNLEHEANNLELFVVRENSRLVGHASIFHSPEADYCSISSESPTAAQALLGITPGKCELTIEPTLYESIRSVLPDHTAYPNNLMVVTRGKENIVRTDRAVRLSVEDAPKYLRFGTSFNAPEVPLDWARERLLRDIVFGVFEGDSLASIASVVGRIPSMAVIMGVETREEFRGRWYATVATSAATREALRLSNSCALFVRSDNSVAIHIYEKIG